MTFALGDAVLSLDSEEDGQLATPSVIVQGPYQGHGGQTAYMLTCASPFGDFQITRTDIPESELVLDTDENRAASAQRITDRQVAAVQDRRRRRARMAVLEAEIDKLQEELFDLEKIDDHFDPTPEAIRKQEEMMAEFNRLADQAGMGKNK